MQVRNSTAIDLNPFCSASQRTSLAIQEVEQMVPDIIIPAGSITWSMVTDCRFVFIRVDFQTAFQ